MNTPQFIQWETVQAPTVHHAGHTVTPQSQAITIRLPLPFPQTGFELVWHRPVAVLVEQDGVEMRIPIYNLNRLMIIALLGISMMLLMPIWLLSRIIR